MSRVPEGVKEQVSTVGTTSNRPGPGPALLGDLEQLASPGPLFLQLWPNNVHKSYLFCEPPFYTSPVT